MAMFGPSRRLRLCRPLAMGTIETSGSVDDTGGEAYRAQPEASVSAGTGTPIADPYDASPFAPPDVEAPSATIGPSAVMRTAARSACSRNPFGAPATRPAGTVIVTGSGGRSEERRVG